METKDGPFFTRTPDPFGDSAKTRLAHMGVSDGEGRLSLATVRTLAEIFAGLFFDDIRELRDDPQNPEKIREALDEMLENGDWRGAYLFISLWYDRMRKPLPDPFVKRHKRNTMRALESSLRLLGKIDAGECPVRRLGTKEKEELL